MKKLEEDRNKTIGYCKKYFYGYLEYAKEKTALLAV